MLWGFWDFNPSWGMLLAIVNAVESAQIYPKLSKIAKIYQFFFPKTISLRNFARPPKIEILVFLKNKNFYL